jgi:hypothetical protein
MKRLLSVMVILVVAIVSCIVGFFMGYELAHNGQPAVVVGNLASATIPQIMVHTDRGESHVIANLASHRSNRVEISPQEKGVQIVARLADGKELRSQEQYVGSQGILFASILEDSIDLHFEL